MLAISLIVQLAYHVPNHSNTIRQRLLIGGDTHTNTLMGMLIIADIDTGEEVFAWHNKRAFFF